MRQGIAVIILIILKLETSKLRVERNFSAEKFKFATGEIIGMMFALLQDYWYVSSDAVCVRLNVGRVDVIDSRDVLQNISGLRTRRVFPRVRTGTPDRFWCAGHLNNNEPLKCHTTD